MSPTSNSDLLLVDLLDAIRDHMQEHRLPEPYTVQISPGSSSLRAAISVHLREIALSAVAGVLSIWADTLTEASLSIWRPPDSESAHIQVSGRLVGGVSIEVWAGVQAPVGAIWLEPGQTQALPLGLLRTWAATVAAEQRSPDALAGGAA